MKKLTPLELCFVIAGFFVSVLIFVTAIAGVISIAFGNSKIDKFISNASTNDALVEEYSLNINNTNPDGKIFVTMSNDGFEIRDSYMYLDRQSMINILYQIMNSPEYREYGYTRDVSSYIAEWEVHNIAYNLGYKVSHAKHVYLDKEFNLEEDLDFKHHLIFSCYKLLYVAA